MQTNPPVACTLNGRAMEERRRRWDELAGRTLVARVETDRGLRLVFRAEAGVETELQELAALERDCCAFADWTVGSRGGDVVLEVSGSGDEGVAAVQAMFRALTPVATHLP
jgi:hypothetical protein